MGILTHDEESQPLGGLDLQAELQASEQVAIVGIRLEAATRKSFAAQTNFSVKSEP